MGASGSTSSTSFRWPTLIAAIRPAVDDARKMTGDLSANVVRRNVERVVVQLRTSHPTLAHEVASGKLRIVGAVYALDTGRVQWLPEK